MALDVTPVNRNLHTRVTFMALEFEDLFVVLGLAAVMNVVSRFVGGQMSAYLQYGVPLAVVPLLDGLQVRQAARLLERFAELVHEAKGVLRGGPRPANAKQLHERGAVEMP